MIITTTCFNYSIFSFWSKVRSFELARSSCISDGLGRGKNWINEIPVGTNHDVEAFPVNVCFLCH